MLPIPLRKRFSCQLSLAAEDQVLAKWPSNRVAIARLTAQTKPEEGTETLYKER